MKKIVIPLLIFILTILTLTLKAKAEICADPNDDKIGCKTVAYFNDLFAKLEQAATHDPNKNNYREIMQPVAESVDGFYGGSLIDPNFIIIEVYHKSHFLARGYDLKKVKELAEFYRKMKENPSPQLSEPGRGTLLQPKLISIRYPVIKDGKLKNILSMMVRTDTYIKAVGLDKCRAYKIICNEKAAETKGKFTGDYKTVKLKLPSTEWIIQYQK
jgi:hypothetical protein